MSKVDFRQDRMTIAEAADYLGIKVRTLYNWRNTGRHELPIAVPVGSKQFYRRSELDEWLDQRQQEDAARARKPR